MNIITSEEHTYFFIRFSWHGAPYERAKSWFITLVYKPINKTGEYIIHDPTKVIVIERLNT